METDDNATASVLRTTLSSILPPEEITSSSTNSTDSEAMEPEGSGYYVIIGVILVPIAMRFLIFLVCRLLNRRGEVRTEPTVFPFLKALQDSDSLWQSHDGLVTFQSRINVSDWSRLRRRLTPYPARGHDHLQNLLNSMYGYRPGGTPKIKLPAEVVTVSIPRQNFKCSNDCTSFETRDGTPGRWSYRMLSVGIQATYFHLGHQTYLAGICVYLDNRYTAWRLPKSRFEWAFSKERKVYWPNSERLKAKMMEKKWCRLRNQWIILTRNEFGEIDKFVFDGKENRMEAVECFDCQMSDNDSIVDEIPTDAVLPPDCLSWLKVEFCEARKKPVMIGKDAAGDIVHFEWNTSIGKFKMETCYSCKLTARGRFERGGGEEDTPPTYEYLEFIEMVDDGRQAPTLKASEK
ncbi:unnamed protein product [Caenorhabditis sp. 36 PRJEB53466]|nr:unnamed protein product [Caenorhabditis sp. 36 PRJEB53466]